MKPIKYVCKHMIYVHVLKHNCPQCGKQLKVRYESKIVNSNSEEAKIITFHLVVGIIFYLAMLIFVYLIFLPNMSTALFN